MSEIGKNVRITLFGESHGPAVGAVFEGVPAGYPVDMELLRAMMERRAPGRDRTATARFEEDEPEFLSGIKDGVTTGAPLAILVRNRDQRSRNYDEIAKKPRPGHADLAAYFKYRGFQDVRGGGHFSARITAPLVAAGAVARGILEKHGVKIGAHILKIKDVSDEAFDPVNVPDGIFKALSERKFPVIDPNAEPLMRVAVETARRNGDSVGGIVECAVTGLPAGTGAPHLDGLDSAIAKTVFGIPAVKGLEFGDGFRAPERTGCENNDAYRVRDGKIVPETNRAGGVTGGLTFGAPVVFKAYFKPTPSIAKRQKTVDLTTGQEAEISVEGRHDPSVVLRAVPVVVAAAAIAVLSAAIDSGWVDRGEADGLNADCGLNPDFAFCGDGFEPKNAEGMRHDSLGGIIGDGFEPDNAEKTLNDLRAEIDAKDRTIAAAYAERLQLIRKVGAVKKTSGAAVMQTSRETEVIENAVRAAGEAEREAVTELFRGVMEYSKLEQRKIAGRGDRFFQTVVETEKKDAILFISETVACQGAAGAYSELAAKNLFKNPRISFCRSFRDVFESVANETCAFGVLPIENSTAGSVNEVYDLLLEFGLKIVGAKKLRISHCLLGVPGATPDSVKRVFSHPQALAQCRRTLDRMGIVERREVSNTAVAAMTVAASGDSEAAAIASETTAALYGLDILSRDLQDADRNYTRFIVVSSKNFALLDGNRLSLVLSIDHKEGALRSLLGIFASAGENLLKLESRPIPGKEFEFRFYVDLEANLANLRTCEMLKSVGAYCNDAVFLGAYREE